MTHHRYSSLWVGIDGGREGLWREPIWSGVLRIIERHQGEQVYDKESPIYLDLESEFPNEAWRSATSDGKFRPLFRDYPNSWTRTGVISLEKKQFALTLLGRAVLDGNTSKSAVFIEMFKNHSEISKDTNLRENPFEILSAAFLEANRPLSTNEIYWAVMRNYRPRTERLIESLLHVRNMLSAQPDPTPSRRLKNMLSTMRAADLIMSTRRGKMVYWAPLEQELLREIAGLKSKAQGVG